MKPHSTKACKPTKISSAVILTLLLNSACASYTISSEAIKPKPLPSPSPSPSYSAEEDLLRACDQALYDCKTANESKAVVIRNQSDLLLLQEKQITELRESENAWYKSPIVWFILGILTMALGEGLSK